MPICEISNEVGCAHWRLKRHTLILDLYHDLETIYISSIVVLSMFPNRFMQYAKDYIGGNLIFGRIFIRLIQHTNTIISKHLKTSEKRWMSVKTSTSAKAGNCDYRHFQSSVFT